MYNMVNGVEDYQFSEPRPWGGFKILLDRPSYKVKELVVALGQRISYQYHNKRDENWRIVRGFGIVTLDDKELQVTAGDTIDILMGQKHRIQNTGVEDLVFIEIQTGTYFGEDDIVRISDDYNRVA